MTTQPSHSLSGSPVVKVLRGPVGILALRVMPRKSALKCAPSRDERDHRVEIATVLIELIGEDQLHLSSLVVALGEG